MEALSQKTRTSATYLRDRTLEAVAKPPISYKRAKSRMI
jgi:hypothetical protein